MTKPLIKMQKNILNAILLSELMSLNYSEISTYEKMHYELKNVQNVLGILLKTILKSETIVSTRTNIQKIAECYTFLIHCSAIFGGNIIIENTSENI